MKLAVEHLDAAVDKGVRRIELGGRNILSLPHDCCYIYAVRIIWTTNRERESMESAAQTLVSNVGQLLTEEYRQLRGVGSEVAELRDDLATMNALLRMQSEADDGAVDHFVREWMKQLRELAYDSEDCIDLYLLRIRCRLGDGVRARLRHQLATLFPRRRLAGDIGALRARAVAISERHARYGVSRDALRRSASPAVLEAAPAWSSSSQLLRHGNGAAEHQQQVVGIGDQVDDLVERLVGTESKVKVLSIVGFGGVGKTTLAVEVCRKLEADFQRQAMVSVSQAFEPSRDLKLLLKRVVEQVVKSRIVNEENIKEEGALGEIDSLDDNKLAQKLEHLLMDKRYLIVIDDVWTIRAWEAIQSKMPENNCGSRVIVTTRIESVAKACSSSSVRGHYIHHMNPLKIEDSRKLFLSRAFGSSDASYPAELKDVMDMIVKKCGGLPLAIVSIASVLAGYRSSGCKDKWETICKSIGYQMESNPTLEGMRQILTLSYNHLPHELKSCLMYLSIFPEDYVIDKYRLLCRWIAEGLVVEKRGLTLMEIAESYFDELVSRNMIELRTGFGYYWQVESCQVHDMLLEVMVSKSLECNFVSLLGGQYASMSYDRIRRLSLQGDDNRRPQSLEQHKEKKGIEGMDVEHVRSLSMFQHGGQKLLDHLHKFTLLRVLDLEGCEDLTNDHMRYVCRLYLLRFLSLKGTNISKISPQIEKLEHLQTIDLRDTKVTGLSEAVKRLYKLERIQTTQTWKAEFMWRLPRGLKKMKALREVGFAVLGNDVQVAQEVTQLEQIQELSVYVETEYAGSDNVVKEFAKSLGKLYSLRRLIIGAIDMDKEALNFLHQLPTPPRLLRYLMIAGGMIDKGLPTWVGSLTYLVHFNMSWAYLVRDQLFGVLYELPSLKTIGIQNMCYTDSELVAHSEHRFSELTNLRVACSFETFNTMRFEKGSMPMLETLLFNFSNRDRKIEGFEHLISLKEVHLCGQKNNPRLGQALEQLKAENARRRLESQNQFQIVVTYD
ncbi:disease resistance protein Pik-2-like [Oryza brachyantha]|uniref:disease resistance protein Pik-2-like n=1 Tax=Oryza brachyantha TaxID=4533 RepID=UPI001AD95AA2|nr:disease resistance protein Pik-2-like [Oryza brachyantha]